MKHYALAGMVGFVIGALFIGGMTRTNLIAVNSTLDRIQRQEMVIGNPANPQCSLKLTGGVEVWNQLNAMGIYRWVSECENDLTKKDKIDE